MKRPRGNRLIDIATRPKPATEPEAPVEVREVPQEAESPSIDVYLDPDVEHGRPRIVIMLSEDGERIENLLYTRMSYQQAVSNVSIVSNVHVQLLLAHLVNMANQEGTLLAEIEFLRDKLAKGISPPRDPVHPAPLMPTAEAGE
jgi:hypothetical protein